MSGLSSRVLFSHSISFHWSQFTVVRVVCSLFRSRCTPISAAHFCPVSSKKWIGVSTCRWRPSISSLVLIITFSFHHNTNVELVIEVYHCGTNIDFFFQICLYDACLLQQDSVLLCFFFLLYYLLGSLLLQQETL